MPGLGKLGSGEIKGRSSSTSFRKLSLLILKFFFQSSAKLRPLIMWSHHKSVLPGLIQNRFRFRIVIFRRDALEREINGFDVTERIAKTFFLILNLRRRKSCMKPFNWMSREVIQTSKCRSGSVGAIFLTVFSMNTLASDNEGSHRVIPVQQTPIRHFNVNVVRKYTSYRNESHTGIM